MPYMVFKSAIDLRVPINEKVNHRKHRKQRKKKLKTHRCLCFPWLLCLDWIFPCSSVFSMGVEYWM